MLMSLHLSIASRLLMAQPDTFSALTAELAAEVGPNVTQDAVAGRLLDVWLDKMPCVTQPERKKLLSLALCSLLPSGWPPVVDRLLAVVANVVETLNDVTRTDEETGDIVE